MRASPAAIPVKAVDRALWAVAALLFGLTAWASLRRTVPDLLDVPDQDKIGHAVAYFAVLLPMLFAAVWRPGRGDGPFADGARWLALGLLAVGVGFEVLQALVTTTRSPELLDVVAEAIGIGAALGVFSLVRRLAADRGPGPGAPSNPPFGGLTPPR